MTEAQCDGIANIINDPEGHGVPRWFLNRQKDYKEGKNLQVASNILETKLREDIERLYKIRCNKGIRHKWGLKVRGQHTKTTGRRGKTVGVERKKKWSTLCMVSIYTFLIYPWANLNIYSFFHREIIFFLYNFKCNSVEKNQKY